MVKADLEDYSPSQDMKLLNYALHGYRSELRAKIENKINVAYLELNDAFQAQLPPDYSRYTKIGVVVCGRIITLSVNEDLVLQNVMDGCGDNVLDEIDAVCACQNSGDFGFGWWYASHMRNGMYVGEQYGQTGGHNARGYYRVFKEQNLIQFDVNFPKFTIIMEYVSDGTGDNGQTIIGMNAVEPLRSYIHWQRVRFGSSPSMAYAEGKKNEFYRAMADYKHFTHCPTVDEWLDASYGSYMSSVKR